MHCFSQQPGGFTGENSDMAQDPSSFTTIATDENNTMDTSEIRPDFSFATADEQAPELAPLNHMPLNHIALNQLGTPSVLPFRQPAAPTLCLGPCRTMIDPATSPWCDTCHPPSPCARIGCFNVVTLAEGLEADICATCRWLKKCGACPNVLASAEPSALCGPCRGAAAYCATRGCASVVPVAVRGGGWGYCQLCSKPCAGDGCAGQTTAADVYCNVCARVAYDLAEHNDMRQTPPNFGSQGLETMMAGDELFLPQQRQQQTPPNFASPGRNLMTRSDELFLQSGYTAIAAPRQANLMDDGSVFSALDSEMADDDLFHVARPTELNFLLQPFIPHSTPVESDIPIFSPQCDKCGCHYSAEEIGPFCPQCDSEAVVVAEDDDFAAEPLDPRYPFM